MYIKNGIQISDAEAERRAEASGKSLNEWAEESGFSLIASEGKPTDPPKTNLSEGQEILPADGESSSANGSLGSVDYDIRDDLELLAGYRTMSGESVFRFEEEEAEGALEAYFRPVKGLNFEQTGVGDRIFIEYTNANGEKVKSETMRFDTGDLEKAKANLNTIYNFVTQNVPQSELNKIPSALDALKQERQKQLESLVDEDDIININTEFDKDDLFKPRTETKRVSMGPERSAASLGFGSGQVGSTYTVTIQPYEKELEQAKADLIKQYKLNNVTLPEDELEIQAKKLVREQLKAEALLNLKIARNKEAIKEGRLGRWFDNKGIDKRMQGRQFSADVFLRNDASKEYDAIVEQHQAAQYEKDLVISAYNRLTELAMPKDDSSLDDIANNEEANKRLQKDLDYLGITIDPNNQKLVELKNGEIVPEEYVKALNALSAQYEGIKDLPDKFEQKKIDAAGKLEDAKLALDASRRNYDLSEKSLNTIATGFGDLALGTLMLSTYVNPLGLTMRIAAGDEIDQTLYQAKKYLDKTRDLYQTNVSFEDAFSNAGNFGEFMLQEISSQIPILTTMILSGGAASIVAGATSAGGKILEMKSENIEGLANYSEAEMLLKGAGYGLAEGLFAQITTTRILKNVKGQWASVGKNSAVNNGIKNYAKANYKELLLEPFAEAGGEILTTGSQNLIDGNDPTLGIDHSGFSGYSIGLAMQAIPFVRGAYVSSFSDYNKRESIRQKARKIEELTAQVAKASTKAERNNILNEIEVVKNEYVAEIESVENIVSTNLRHEHAQQVIDITQQQTDLQNQVIEIQKGPGTVEGKRAKIAAIEKQFQNLENTKRNSLQENNMQRYRPEFALLKEVNNARYNQIIAKAKAKFLNDGKGDYNTVPTESQLDKMGYEIYLEEDIQERNKKASKVEGANLVIFKTVKEAIDALKGGRFGQLSEDQVTERIAFLEGGDHGFQIEDGPQVVIEENQLKEQMRNIGTHEVGHHVFDKLTENNPELEKKIAVQLLGAARQKLSKSEYKRWLRSIETQTTEAGDNQFKPAEVIARFLELVADNEVTFREGTQKRGLLGLLGSTIQYEFKDSYDFDFKGEEDIVNFVVGLGKKIKEGTLTRADIEAAAQNPILESEIKDAINDGEAKKAENIVNMTDIREPRIAASAAASRASNRLEELQENDNFDPNSAETYDILQGMVGAQLSKYTAKGLQISDMQEAVADVTARLYTEGDVGKFDGRGTLYGFLNGRIKFRILDSFKTKPDWIENFGETEIQDLTGKQAQEVSVDAEVETTTAQPEAPTYKNLLERKTLTEEAVTRVKDKVKSTVRVMKTKIDQAVSKNVTVKPYIAEIKKAMGKQADIDFKKEMGGLKDGELRRYLLRHKRAILENMTTTYLMTAMPNAVQKQVNGVFTSDWKGKKIDREKVTTDQAGRTSGAEIVRRLPNASVRLSDADFLSNFFTEDGKLIRGRKESLAKAMAEEVSFDIISESLQNPESEIYQALESRQEMLGAEIADNFVAVVERDMERGNVKRSAANVDNVRNALGAELNGDNQSYLYFLDLLPKVLKEKTQDLISSMLTGVTSGFKDPLRAAKYPDSLKSYITGDADAKIKGYFGSGTLNRNNTESVKKMLDANEAVIDAMAPELLANLEDDVFGIHDRYGRKSTNEKAAKLSAKKAAKVKNAKLDYDAFFNEHGFDPRNIVVYQGNHGIFNQIRNNILNKDFESVEAKHEAYRERYGDKVDKANYANIKALEYIIQKHFESILKDNSKLEGFLMLMEAQVNMGRSLRGLTQFGDIEIFAESQGAYVNTKTGQYYSKLNTDSQKAKFKSGEIVINTKHPLYKPAVEFMEKTTAERKKQGKKPLKYDIVYYLNFKGEHAFPSSKMMAYLAIDVINAVGKINDNSESISDVDERKEANDGVKNALRTKIADRLQGFTQQLNSNLSSEIQDSSKLGKTTEVGDLRLVTLDKKMAGAFIDQNGMQAVSRVDREIIDYIKGETKIEKQLGFNEDAYIEAATKVEQINKRPEVKRSAAADKINKEFNDILERKSGVESFKTFSDVQAEIRGRKKGKFKFFVAPAVEDFRGLVNYAFAGRGKQGEQDMAWMEEKLMTPYAKGIAAIDGVRQQIKADFKQAVKTYPKEYKLLKKEIPDTNFTYDQAVRVYLWERSGFDVPGLSKKDLKILRDAIQQNPELIQFANSMLLVGRRTQWIEPSEYWLGGSILGDLNEMTEKVGRKEYLAEFIENADVIFSKENLNKIEAIKGKAHREAIEDSLYSMKNGTNRQQGQSKIVGKWLNWLNGSTGAIMFFNRRSALLQMLSTTNFINYSDNNILKAGAAFANQKQYWADWSMIFNSDKLRERRGGLRQDVSANEIASVANDSKNSPKAIIAYLLKIGFKPTQLADSFAIATGGAAFYRNRVNTYLKEGKTEKEAKEQAFLDFSKISDETQQSSDPALVSQIQRSVLGRLVFAFQNTPMQITRLIKKDALDLINGRGDWKVKVSRIAYYGAVQNLIFSSLQSALFALIPGFDDDEEDNLTDKELEKRNEQDEARITRALNSMLDTLLRGSGVYGAVFATAKNVVREYIKQEKKGFIGDDAYTILALFDISPPIGSKARKVNSAIKTRKFEKDEIAARGWAITGEGRLDLGPNWSILGKVTSATLNLPLDRVVDELTSVSEAFDARNTAWQRFALALGWKTWDIGAKDELGDLIRAEAGARRKEEAAEKRRKKAEEKKTIEAAKTPEQKAAERKQKEAEKEAKRKEKEAKRQKVIEDKSIIDQEAIYDLTKSQQIEALKNLGLDLDFIKTLKREEQRVNKIIELRNKIKK